MAFGVGLSGPVRPAHACLGFMADGEGDFGKRMRAPKA